MVNGNPFVYSRSEAIKIAKKLAKRKDCEVFVMVACYPDEFYVTSDDRFVYGGMDDIACVVLSDGTIESE